MRRRLSSLGLVAILGIIGVLCVGSASFAALPPQWSAAIEVPGTAALNVGGYDGAYADTEAVSCATPGNCAAGGGYFDATGTSQAFVVNETNGTWGTAIEVPGTSSLNTGNAARTYSVSCGTAGNCAAVGNYADASGYGHAFVVDETNGTWGTA